MSEPMNAETAAPAETPVVEQTNLPSDTPEANPWDAKELLGEDGMVGGKYKSLEALLKSAQAGDEHIAKLNAEKQSTNDNAANAQAAAEVDSARMDTAKELVRTVLESGMEMSAETLAAAKEAGIPASEIELAAMKGKAHIDKMTSLVGGQETYSQMMTDMGATMSDAEKAQFTKDVEGSTSEYTIKGIHQAWLEKTGQKAPAQRVTGEVKQQIGNVKPYANQLEIQQDLRYLQTKGKNDKAAWAAHNARKSITPDSAFYGR